MNQMEQELSFEEIKILREIAREKMTDVVVGLTKGQTNISLIL